MILKFADFLIEFENQRNFPGRFYKEYTHYGATDTIVKIKIPRYELEAFCQKNKWYELGYMEALYFYQRLADQMPLFGAFLLHSATFDVDGVGCAFAAASGTGKTTQMLNWQKLLGDKLTIVNGDKPIIRFFDKDFCEENGLDIPEGTEFGVPYAYGTPWCGKERFGCNMRTPLKHICFIERSDTNFVTKIEKHEAIDRIMRQVYIPRDPEALSKTLELVDRLINSCELWIIHCNMEPESAKIAYETIIGE